MFKQTVKKTIGKALRQTRSYIQSLEAGSGGSSGESAAVPERNRNEPAYVWLNSLLAKLLQEGGSALRPNYTWGVLQGVQLAKAIGINRVSVIEFGVAGGNGLISLEKSAERIEKIFDVGIDVYGFDTGRGLPKPVDYRDCPNLWSAGNFSMDKEKLQSRLQRARLVLGLVDKTVLEFVKSRPSPVAFISFDLDYYSSTIQAFKLLEAGHELLLPRVYCYFDDIMGFTYSDYTGERLAIAEFNASHNERKISPCYGLRYYLPSQYSQEEWAEQIYIAHTFNHRLYTSTDGSGGGWTDLVDSVTRAGQ